MTLASSSSSLSRAVRTRSLRRRSLVPSNASPSSESPLLTLLLDEYDKGPRRCNEPGLCLVAGAWSPISLSPVPRPWSLRDDRRDILPLGVLVNSKDDAPVCEEPLLLVVVVFPPLDRADVLFSSCLVRWEYPGNSLRVVSRLLRLDLDDFSSSTVFRGALLEESSMAFLREARFGRCRWFLSSSSSTSLVFLKLASSQSMFHSKSSDLVRRGGANVVLSFRVLAFVFVFVFVLLL